LRCNAAAGRQSLYLSPEEVGLGKRESIADVARVLSRFVDVIVVRTFAQHNLEVLAEYASVPVINALSDYEHPCRRWRFTDHLRNKRQAKMADAGLHRRRQQRGNSLMLACAMAGCELQYRIP